ncbi:MAG: hypothetical protein ABL995_07860, partial [Bryobacteraceae bacterium]
LPPTHSRPPPTGDTTICTSYDEGGTAMDRTLQPLTQEEFARAEARLRNPAPGSKVEAAQKHGVDLTLLIEQLRLTPAERVRKMLAIAEAAAAVRGAAGTAKRKSAEQ